MENSNAFIICEYNPFHKGHKYHIERTRKTGAENVICIMSGNFVQRGEPAFTDRFLRAEAAVREGADLVLEMPVKYAVATANGFAKGGIGTAFHTGLSGTVSFGASAGIPILKRASSFIHDDETVRKTEERMREQNIPYAYALAKICEEEQKSEFIPVLADPNNVLAIEYISNAEHLGAPFGFTSIKRESRHDAEFADIDHISAKPIREMILNGREVEIGDLLPDNSRELLSEAIRKGHVFDKRNYHSAALSRLQLMSEKDFLKTDNVGHGLENRIVQALKGVYDLDDVFMRIKSKRYTLSRIRQIMIQSTLGITADDMEAGVKYLRVLAFNDKGRELLGIMRKTASRPVITNLSDALHEPDCARDAFLEEYAAHFYELCVKTPSGRNAAFSEKVRYLR